MDILDITQNPHNIPSYLYQKYGPPLSFWESIRMGGTGSPRLWLRNAGPILLDHIQANLHQVKEPVKSQFQLLKNALIVRILVRPSVHLAIFKETELAAIHLRNIVKPSEEDKGKMIAASWLPSYSGTVELHFTGDLLTWEFETAALRATQKYFARSFLADRFFYHKR